MNIKKNENVSDFDIDKILTEKYDLGFLLEQIKNNKYEGVYFLSIIDVLRFIPQFNESVKQIRNGLQINPTVINKNLCQLYGKDHFLQFITISKEIGRGINFPNPDDIDLSSISDKINDWKQSYYPTLSAKVATLRLKTLGKAPHTWQESIEDYILFEKISSVPLIFRKSLPDMTIKNDLRTQEPHIEIKVYADSDVSIFQKTNQWKKIKKTLPAYFEPNELDERLILTRFMQFILRKHLKLNQHHTLKWLERHKLFNRPDYEHSSQEVKRFEGLFISTRK